MNCILNISTKYALVFILLSVSYVAHCQQYYYLDSTGNVSIKRDWELNIVVNANQMDMIQTSSTLGSVGKVNSTPEGNTNLSLGIFLKKRLFVTNGIFIQAGIQTIPYEFKIDYTYQGTYFATQSVYTPLWAVPIRAGYEFDLFKKKKLALSFFTGLTVGGILSIYDFQAELKSNSEIYLSNGQIVPYTSKISESRIQENFIGFDLGGQFSYAIKKITLGMNINYLFSNNTLRSWNANLNIDNNYIENSTTTKKLSSICFGFNIGYLF